MWLEDIKVAFEWIGEHTDKKYKCCIDHIENNIIYWTDGSRDDIKACVDMAKARDGDRVVYY